MVRFSIYLMEQLGQPPLELQLPSKIAEMVGTGAL